MSAKRPPASPPKRTAGCPAWMMTFGDCMSLLVTFFVMLIAFSSLEEAKLASLVGVLRGAFGAVEIRHSLGAIERKAMTDVELAADSPEVDHAIRGEAESLRFLSIEELSDAMPDFINEIRQHGEELLSDRILIQMLDEGLSIVLKTTDLFETGGVAWSQDCTPIWEGVAGLLQGRKNEIRITSVTSATAPVRPTVAASSWGLGIARADNIARELQVATRSEPSRFGIGVQVYDDEGGLAEDDHVEIMIMEKNNVIDIDSNSSWPKGIWR